MKLREEYSHLDTQSVFDIEITDEDEPEGCSCGDVLMGLKTPLECKLYSRVCKPDSPIGPCMVSSEGACAAYYKYGRT
jgi:hydrogenase expression/formation protein HypD